MILFELIQPKEWADILDTAKKAAEAGRSLRVAEPCHRFGGLRSSGIQALGVVASAESCSSETSGPAARDKRRGVPVTQVTARIA